MSTPSSVQYQWLPGPAGEMLRSSSLATTARISLGPASLIVTTGHVGIDLKTGQLVTNTIEAEFNAIFDCLDAALRNAGAARGLLSAFKIVAYLTRAEDDVVLNQVFRKKYPGHTPTWTSVEVKGLVSPGAHAEVRADAIV
ncbi:hypothetical protein F5883DRAFT_523742 [Diaporthe sp. PMI_573]|nr:hypothetical protein F5883DRAFT_523742 [Diaporthaceae sp. PMI_573]